MATKKCIVIPKRGEVYLVNFDPTIWSEIQKTRPALVLQNDIGNEYSAVTIVATITSTGEGKVYPTQVVVHPREGGLLNHSHVLLNQIRTVDKRRFGKRLGTLTPSTMRKVDMALSLSVGLVDVS